MGSKGSGWRGVVVLALLLLVVSVAGSAANGGWEIIVTVSVPNGSDTATQGDCDDPVLLIFAMDPDDVFTLSYRHSVEQTLIQETFVIHSDHGLVLVAMHYESFGAGLPYAPEEGTFTKVGDRYVWTDFSLPLGRFSMMATPENQYVLRYPAGERALDGWPAGTVFTFAVKSNHRLQ